MTKTQLQMFYDAHKKSADNDKVFLELMQDMTRQELATLIEKRPALWGRYRAYLSENSPLKG